MNFITEPSKQVPVIQEVDICVIGGSCTGVFAAVRAAKLGARVAIVENNGYFGGVATAGLVNIWHSLYDTEHERLIIGGLTHQVIETLSKRGCTKHNPSQPFKEWVLNSSELVIELDKLVVDNKITPFLHTKFVDSIHEDGEVKAVLIENKNGRGAIKAKYFIDASGDADLAQKTNLGITKEKILQPPTTCAIYSGLSEILEMNPDMRIQDEVFNTKYPEALKQGFMWLSDLPGSNDTLRMVAGTRVYDVDCSDADQLTFAEMEGRRQVRKITDIVKKYFKGGEKIALQQLPSYIGIRETNKVVGEHRLTQFEVLNGVRFDDAIANGSYEVDVHHNDKPGLTFKYLNGQQIYVVPGKESQESMWRPKQDVDPTFYQVPYRSLIPKGTKNVLVAGRCIDTDNGAYGATRVMVNTNQMGEAAGTAAYLALDSNQNVKDIDVSKLRSTLAGGGSIII